VLSQIYRGELCADGLAGLALEEDEPPGYKCSMVWHARSYGEEPLQFDRIRPRLAECDRLHGTARFEERK
jgi:hypothetical protein